MCVFDMSMLFVGAHPVPIFHPAFHLFDYEVGEMNDVYIVTGIINNTQGKRGWAKVQGDDILCVKINASTSRRLKSLSPTAPNCTEKLRAM